MPASYGLRSRPQIGMMRSISTHRLDVINVAHVVPKAMILPIVLAACVTVAVATLWTYGIHADAALAAADDLMTPGTVKTN